MAYQVPADLEERVQAHMATGRYASEDEVLRDALDMLDTVEAQKEDAENVLAAEHWAEFCEPLDHAPNDLPSMGTLLDRPTDQLSLWTTKDDARNE